MPAEKKYDEDHGQPFYLPVIYALLHAFAGMTAANFSVAADSGMEKSRKAQLTQEFKSLLVQQMKTTKSPAAYAEKLNVSVSYLNEALKKLTGLPVSYWIMQEVMLEAKRLLYYSQLNVKEIAHELGYEDHTYFQRLFKQHMNITPLAFRARYRE